MLADRCVAVFFGDRIFTLMFGHPERARATVKAKSKDPEGVYAITPQKGVLTGLVCRRASLARHPVAASEICSAGLHGYRDMAVEPSFHAQLTKVRSRDPGWHVVGASVLVESSIHRS